MCLSEKLPSWLHTVNTAPASTITKLKDCCVARDIFSLPDSSPHRSIPSSDSTVIFFFRVDRVLLLCVVAYRRRTSVVIGDWRSTREAVGKGRGRAFRYREFMAMVTIPDTFLLLRQSSKQGGHVHGDCSQ